MASLSVRGKLRLAVLVKITTPLMVVLALPYLTVLTPVHVQSQIRHVVRNIRTVLTFFTHQED